MNRRRENETDATGGAPIFEDGVKPTSGKKFTFRQLAPKHVMISYGDIESLINMLTLTSALMLTLAVTALTVAGNDEFERVDRLACKVGSLAKSGATRAYTHPNNGTRIVTHRPRSEC